MRFVTDAILCAARPQGETGVLVRVMTQTEGMIGAYVAGGRGRHMRPVLIPGNRVAVEIATRHAHALPLARIELVASRAPFLAEPLPAAAIGWSTTLAAAALPERHAYPLVYDALDGVLDAVCHAPSARGWVPGMLTYETLVLRELGYGGGADLAAHLGAASSQAGVDADWPMQMARFQRLGDALSRYLLADRRRDVMGARARLGDLLARIAG